MTEQSEYSFCSHWGCPEPHYAKGKCKVHYTADIKRKKRAAGIECSIEGCTRHADVGTLCTSHYRRKRTGALDTPIRPVNQIGCTVEGCEGKHFARGQCKRHYKSPSKASSSGGMLKQKYRIDLNDRQRLIDAQDGRCAICLEEPTEGHPLCVDHDHTHCGGPRSGCRDCVRGLLCPTCNTRIGKIDGTGWLERAIAYLADPPAQRVL